MAARKSTSTSSDVAVKVANARRRKQEQELPAPVPTKWRTVYVQKHRVDDKPARGRKQEYWSKPECIRTSPATGDWDVVEVSDRALTTVGVTMSDLGYVEAAHAFARHLRGMGKVVRLARERTRFGQSVVSVYRVRIAC